ncbi:MAG TPA: ABC transporter permease [Solirubrobacteraceae bacterium]|nr:ABC transporter permease [Solirubrobacteraceae bacterium]
MLSEDAPLVTDQLVRGGIAQPAVLVRSPWRELVRSVRSSPSSVVGAVVLGALVLIAVLAPVIAPYGPNQQVGVPFASPSGTHLLGLDDGGYDVLSLLMWGLRVSLLVGFAATLIASLLGAVVGVAAGYFGGFVDGVLMRVTDYFLVIPLLPLMIVIADAWGASLFHIIAVIGLLSWTMTAIVIRAQVRSVRERVYIKRAVALGATHRRIIFRHILPQVMPLLVANTVLNLAYAVFTETALAFLGLGDPNQVSLGTMIEHSFLRAAISSGAWWAVVSPGALVAIAVLAASLLGRTIEDSLNPRLRTAHLSSRRFRVREIARARATEPEVA